MGAAKGVEGRAVAGQAEDDGLGAGLLDIFGLLLVEVDFVGEDRRAGNLHGELLELLSIGLSLHLVEGEGRRTGDLHGELSEPLSLVLSLLHLVGLPHGVFPVLEVLVGDVRIGWDPPSVEEFVFGGHVCDGWGSQKRSRTSDFETDRT